MVNMFVADPLVTHILYFKVHFRRQTLKLAFNDLRVMLVIFFIQQTPVCLPSNFVFENKGSFEHCLMAIIYDMDMLLVKIELQKCSKSLRDLWKYFITDVVNVKIHRWLGLGSARPF